VPRALRPGDNPFASHAIERLAFRLHGLTRQDLLERLGALGWRAAIVGPQGSGKTTLLEELARHLGEAAVLVRLPGSCRSPLAVARAALPRPLARHHVVLTDSAEQLGPVAWRRWLVATRRARGLVITAHLPGRLPTLIETTTSPELLADLVEELAPAEMHRLEPLLPALLEMHGGDIRACLRALYDRCADRRRE
jgi:hypothetical protein